MSCYHPFKAFVVGTKDNGKDDLVIRPYAVTKIGLNKNGIWENYYDDTIFRSDTHTRVVSRFIEIPCNNCIGCRIDRSREWANRMMLELEYHDSAYFVTLTYNEEHVPTSFYPDPETGEALPVMTLKPKDPQDWLKRLRKAFPDDHIRYFLCGEYGTETHRPHYHAIVYGLHLDDLRPIPGSRDPNYQTSDKLQRTWSVKDKSCYTPLGFVLVAPVTWQSCAYVARYVTKKLYGKEAEFYENFGLCPEFTRCSRRPGLGREYFDDHPDCCSKPFLYLSTEEKGVKFPPPKYFQRILADEDPAQAAELKEKRTRFAELAKKARLQNTDLDYLEYLQVQEDNFKAKTASLLRNKV